MATHKGQLKFGIGFDVDKNSLQVIKNDLAEIQKLTAQGLMSNNPSLGLKEVQSKLIDIKRDAATIQTALERAFNPNLGSINVAKFDEELKKANLDLSKVYMNFKAAGSVGTQAFQQLSSSVLTSNLQLRQTHKILDNISQTMINTAKWGIASSVFNNMTSSIQKSWNYVQKLDKSLNDIRIVSDATASDMEKFAKYANNAAKSLGSTTLDYTKGALIYYQQGLDEEEVRKRTDITLKMSNVLGTSAEEVSDYMTAIWNNFDDGSQSLEYYADVLTKLGAATASSAEEISTGLEKFASISQTVGLSYEYAAAALTTVTDRTRQSAEVVGTAFKTLFARIQGLSLGETLEDGTTLNKYSEALQAVGISIKDQNGELKDMDTILDEMGSKWQTLNKDQQVALAQTVAGVRQYNQLMSLMNNWDFFQKNVETARGSTGELQKQQDIYLESTEAHLNQLTTAWQRVYSAAIDNGKANGIIDLLTKMTNGVANWFEAMGGGTNILLTLGSVATTVFSKQIASGLNTTISNFEAAKFNAEQLTNQLKALKAINDSTNGGDTGSRIRYEETAKMQNHIGVMSVDQINQAHSLIDKYADLESMAQQYQQDKEEAIQIIIDTMEQANQEIDRAFAEEALRDNGSNEFMEYAQEYETAILEDKDKILAFFEEIKNAQEGLNSKYVEEQTEAFDDLTMAIAHAKEQLELLADRKDLGKGIRDEAKAAAEGLNFQIDKKDPLKERGQLTAIAKAEKVTKKAFGEIENNAQKVSNVVDRQMSGAFENIKIKANGAKKDINNFFSDIERTNALNTLTKAVGAFGQLAASIMAIKNLGNIWSNEDVSTGEKILQTIMSLGTTLPMIIISIKNLSDSWSGLITFGKAFAEAFTTTIAKTGSQIISNTALIGSNKAVKKSEEDVNKAKASGIGATGEKIASNTAEIGSNAALIQSNKVVAATSKTAGAGMATTEVATVGVEKAAIGAGPAMEGLGASLGTIAATAAIAVAAIAAVAGVIYLCVKAYNKDEDAAKAAAKAAEEAAKRFEDASKIYESSLNEISKYQEAKKGLDELKKGTVEWKNAVNELNMQVLDLIEKYPELLSVKDALSKNDGVLSLSDDAINTMLYTRYNNVQSAARDKMLLQSIAYDKRDAADLTKTTRKISSYRVANPEYNRTLAQQKSSNVLGTENIPANKTTEYYSKSVTNEEVQKVLDALNNYGTALWSLSDKDFAKEVGLANEEAVAVIKEARKDINKLNESTNKNTTASEALKEQYADSYISSRYVTDQINNGNSKNIQSYLGLEDNQKAVVNKMVKSYWENFEENNKKKNEEIDEKYDAGVFGWAWLGKGNYSDKEIHKRYAEAMGYDTSNIEDQTGKATFKTQDGEVTVSDDDIRTFLKSEEKLKIAANKTEEYAQQLSKTYDKGLEVAERFNLNSSETQNFLDNITGAQGIDFSSASDQELAAYKEMYDSGDLKNFITDEIAQAAGEEDAKAYLEAFNKEYEKWSSEEMAAERAANRAKVEQEAYNQAIKNGAKELDISETELKDYVLIVQENNEVLKENRLLAVDVAKAAITFGKGVQKIGDAIANNKDLLDDWRKGLTESEQAIAAVAQLQDAFKETFGVDVSTKFIKDNFEDIEKLINGDTSALQELQALAAKEVLFNIKANLPEDKFNWLNSKIDEINAKDIDIGAELDDTDFINALNEMIENGQMTEEQVNQALSAIGYEPEFEPVEGETTAQAPLVTKTNVSADIFGKNIHVASLTAETTLPSQVVQALGISAKGVSGSGGQTRKLKGARKVASTGSRAKAVQNSGSSGNRTGGNGGGGSSSQPRQVDRLKDEADRYHQIDAQIKLITNALDSLEKQQKKTFGKDYLNNLNKQYSLLNKQITNYNEKLKIAQGEQNELNKKLSGQGVKFNSDGTISNYMQAFAAQEAYVNGLIDQYNRLSAAEQEKWDEAKTIDNAKERFDEFKKDLDRYDELVTDFIPDLQKNIQEAIDKQIEIDIEKFNYEIKIRLDMSEAQRDWNQFLADIKKNGNLSDSIEGDIVRNLQAQRSNFDTYFNASGNGSIQAQTQHINDLLNEIYKMDNGQSNVYGDNRQQALEDLKEYYEQLMSDLKDIVALQEEVHAAYGDMVDEAQEKFDEQVEAFEHISKLVEHDMKLIELVNGEDAYDKLAHYYQIQQDNYNQQLDFQRKQVDFWEQQMRALEEGSEEWKIAKDQWTEALENWQALVEESIENIRNKFENTINDIFKNLNNQITNGLGLDYVADQWDLISKNADQYLDAINAAQGIRDLEKKYLDAIEKTDNVGAQRKLNALMNKELGDLRDRDKLSEYDLERAEKKYQLLLAQIALEEAQQNKNNMRLRRDSQGNYTYQFVADDDEVRKAQDELDKAYNSLYNFDKEAYINNLDEIYSTWDEYQQKMYEASLINDPEARLQKELLIQQQYGDLITALTEKNMDLRNNLHESAFQDLANLYDENIDNFYALSDAEQDMLLGSLIPQWDSAVQAMADKFSGPDGFTAQTKDALDQIHAAAAQLADDLAQVGDTANVDFDAIGEGLDENLPKLEQLVLDNEELIQKYDLELEKVREVIEEVDNLYKAYEKAKNEAIAATDAAFKYTQAQNSQAATAAANNSQTTTAGPSAQNNQAALSSSASGYKLGIAYPIEEGDSLPGIAAKMYGDSSLWREIYKNNENVLKQGLIAGQILQLASGGYTGDWAGNSGRLAALHKKELVLNAKDTENMLNAVSVMRYIVDSVGDSVLSRLASLSGGIGSPKSEITTNREMEQNVHIDATFPNATNAKEIEDAFNNLVNIASQRAYKTN